MHDDVTGWTDFVNMASSDSKKEVPTGRGSFPQPYAFESTSASVNYHDDTDSESTGSDDGFQGLQPSA